MQDSTSSNQPPGGVPLTILDLFQMIGELYAENWMRKRHDANQDLQNGSRRMGEAEQAQAQGGPMYSP